MGRALVHGPSFCAVALDSETTGVLQMGFRNVSRAFAAITIGAVRSTTVSLCLLLQKYAVDASIIWVLG
jgi:hypothetical protein